MEVTRYIDYWTYTVDSFLKPDTYTVKYMIDDTDVVNTPLEITESDLSNFYSEYEYISSNNIIGIGNVEITNTVGGNSTNINYGKVIVRYYNNDVEEPLYTDEYNISNFYDEVKKLHLTDRAEVELNSFGFNKTAVPISSYTGWVGIDADPDYDVETVGMLNLRFHQDGGVPLDKNTEVIIMEEDEETQQFVDATSITYYKEFTDNISKLVIKGDIGKHLLIKFRLNDEYIYSAEFDIRREETVEWQVSI